MPSIFARSRTASTPVKSHSNTSNKNGTQPPNPLKDTPDEFGRVASRNSTLHSPSNKDRKKATKGAPRQRTQSSPHELSETQPVPDGSFLPFSLVPQDNQEVPRQKLQAYGYLSYHNEVVLGLQEITRLVEVISNELGQHGLTTPLLFSNLALDISPSRIRRLIDAFLRTCSNYRPDSPADIKWKEEARFSNPHDLAMTLRWGLARIIRIYQGQETRGIISWEAYLRWREDEAASLYLPDYFEAFLESVPPEVQSLLNILLSFLSRLTAHSNSSGLTPPTLSSLFGPLLFGLGSATLPFHHTYGAYLRCSYASEHLLLAFIRAQDARASRAVGLPSRLKDWIRGYPSMIPPMNKLDKARHGARTVCMTTVRRNVRLYSHDLVKTAAGWASKGERGDLAGCKEWTRVIGPPGAALSPRYSDQYRKRFDIPPTIVPDMGVSGSVTHASPTLGSRSSTTGEEFGLLGKEDEKRFRSLTELKWGEFESAGFGSGNDQRLEFDLNEGARMARNEKRSTLSWNDFSTTGFSRTDAPLSATLQFAAPLTSTISAWPTRQSELQHRLKKTQKALPPFGWDTSPVLGGEEAIEEGFLDVFCDLLYGSGWVNRREQTFRDCNWALVEYKSMPQSRPSFPSPSDPRTAVSLWLYEEFVPSEYRSQLIAPKRKLPFSFTASSKKQWKQAATLNGRPYVMGSVPRPPTTRELEFEGLLSGGNVTKVISLGGAKTEALTVLGSPIVHGGAGIISSPLFTTPEIPMTPTTTTAAGRRSRFFPGSTRKLSPSQYDALDFETRTMSGNLSDDDVSEKDPRRSKSSMGHSRGGSKDDAWVDILVGAQRRMNDQSAELHASGNRRPAAKRHSLSDPDLAREEIAKALKDAGPEPPADDDIALSQDNTHEASQDATDGDVYSSTENNPELSLHSRQSMDSADFEPTPHISSPSQDEPASPPLGTTSHSRTESDLLPPSLQLNVSPSHPESNLPAVGLRTSGKGVSSLIEMYREKEKESVNTLQSKLPVRSSSLSTPKAQPEKSPPASSPKALEDEDPFVGRVSPAAPRYVHGAPLHNVVEAPEEEET